MQWFMMASPCRLLLIASLMFTKAMFTLYKTYTFQETLLTTEYYELIKYLHSI